MSQFYAQWGDGFQVVWRNLTKEEYARFRLRYEQSVLQEPMDIALDIYRIVQIKGPDPNTVPAGIPSYICKQQMLNNPFSGLYVDLAPAIEMARRVVASDYMKCAVAIISSALNYKPEEIEKWDPNTFFIRLAQAEVATGRLFNPGNPNVPVDSKGNPVQKRMQRPLTPSQEKAIARTRQRDKGT